jgi:hypothetical protein
MVAVHPPPSAERRDLLARALRDMLAARLEVHPRRLGGLSAEVVAAMLEQLAEPQAVAAHGRRQPWPSRPVVTPDWDSRAG